MSISCENHSPAFKPSPLNKWPGRVVVNYNSQVTSGLKVDTSVVRQMVDSSIMCLTGATNTGAAWKTLFSDKISVNSKIAIKINILNYGNAAPHYSSVKAITDGLSQMTFGEVHFPVSNITIYDGNNLNTMECAGYSQERFPGIHLVKDTMIRWGDGVHGKAYSRSLHDCDFLINVFSPIGHNRNYGGFFLGFKNHYGSYDHHLMYKYEAGLRDMNCMGPVYNKSVLSVCSGIFGINEFEGPLGGIHDFSVYRSTIDTNSSSKNPNAIIMSTDPVSCEFQTIKMMRINKNRPYSIMDMPDYLKASGGINCKLSPVYNIGIIDEKKMDIRKIITLKNKNSNAPDSLSNKDNLISQ